VADQFGFAHVFWAEILEDGRYVLLYSRYDGKTWTKPIDIRITGPDSSIRTISPVVDKDGVLHLMWSEGQVGPAYYSRADAFNALSAQDWQTPRRVDINASRLEMGIDDAGVIHVAYADVIGSQPGVYYVRSEDGAQTWSTPTWLDPDILPDHAPGSLEFEVDDQGGLHAVWYYIPLDPTGQSDWVRYSHSLNGGRSWSTPFTIAKNEPGQDDLPSAGPIMITQGTTVHVIWAGGELNYRNHRYSTDSGNTWSLPQRIFGDLNGQAFEGMAVDGAGRVHWFGQVRYPQGIYHAYWENGQWSKPTMIYLISRSADDPIGDRVHAHHTHPVIRAGNELILTFADSPPEPDRRLFVTTRLMNDIMAAEAKPTPAPLPTATAAPPTPVIPTPTPVPLDARVAAADLTNPAPADVLWPGFVAPLAIIGVTIAFWMIRRRR
jgi:hypothetical protein